MNLWKLTSLVIVTAGLWLDALGQDLSPKPDATTLDSAITGALERHGDGIRAGLWLGGRGGRPWFARDAGEVFPAASAIKTAYVVELFAAYEEALDAPLPNAAQILSDDAHPAIAHFAPEVRAEARRDLSDLPVRKVGLAMIQGKGVSNAVYNAAANLVTASLGGPQKLQERIRTRDPSFEKIFVRRYMLAARDRPGDNVATPAALASVLQRIAAQSVPRLKSTTHEALRATLFVGEDPRFGRHYSKTGALDSDPLTRVRSGFYERDGRCTVYVVMTCQPDPGSRSRAEAGKALEAICAELHRLLVEAAQR
jgi:hypothetical protein